jgi:hypothetical protein
VTLKAAMPFFKCSASLGLLRVIRRPVLFHKYYSLENFRHIAVQSTAAGLSSYRGYEIPRLLTSLHNLTLLDRQPVRIATLLLKAKLSLCLIN